MDRGWSLWRRNWVKVRDELHGAEPTINMRNPLLKSCLRVRCNETDSLAFQVRYRLAGSQNDTNRHHHPNKNRSEA